MSIIGSNILAGASGQAGYNLNNSLRFRSSASAYLSRTPTVAGNRQTWTISFWWKRGLISSEQYIVSADTSAANETWLRINAADTLQFQTLGGTNANLTTSAVFRDPSAWYHIVMAYDSTQATAGNRFKLYVNGNQQTLTGTNPTLNESQAINNTVSQQFCRRASTSGSYADNYLTDVYLIDGQALTPSSFGATSTTTGSWIPAKYTGTYGTNGFKLNFSDTSAATAAAIGKDSSGNGNNWTPSGISVTAGVTYDAMLDVPTNTSATVGNYCTPNPLDMFSTSVMSNGNLTVNVSGSSSGAGAGGTARVNTINFTGLSGKWYWEAFVDNAGTGVATLRTTFGMIAEPARCSNNPTGAAWTWRADGVNSGLTAASTFATNDVVMFAYDSATGKLWLGKNGTWTNSGVPASGTGNNATLTALAEYALFLNYGTSGGGTGTASFNFGQRPFSYSPPTGFVAVNTYNLPDATIFQGNKYMDATLYTGTGASLAITNAGAFKPDFVWVKGRSGATSHALYDSVRGTTIDLVSDSTAAETTQTTGLTAFGTGGFTVGALAKMNTSAATYVAWQWNANNGTTSSNTNGSITSTVQANASAGFSIVTYTGTGANATVGHGLGVAPKMVIVKKRSATGSWAVYHIGLTSAAYQVWLDLTSAQLSRPTTWNSTAPTSTVFSIGTDTDVNVNAATFVAYCWSEIAGFSKFGSYTGNGSTDGTFVYTGFRPKFILLKNTSSAINWIIYDTSRNTYNLSNAGLFPNTNAVEDTTNPALDILSNGFKPKSSDSYSNASSANYIYMAFAESPFKTSNSR